MASDRRAFLQQALLATCAALSRPTLAAAARTRSSESNDVLARMNWMNPPASFNRSEGKLVVRSRAKTDFWRKTFYGYITDNGHFFSLPVSGDFVFQARVNGQYAALYDQAGLMVRRDAENWMKCGTEFFDGQRHASVVFTRDAI